MLQNVIGDSGVGKTALINSLEHNFVEQCWFNDPGNGSLIAFFELLALRAAGSCASLFTRSYPDVVDWHRKQFTIDGQSSFLDILEIPPGVRAPCQSICQLNRVTRFLQEDSCAIYDQEIRAAHGFLIVYSVASPSSFHEVPLLRDRILRLKDAVACPVVLVGNMARPPCRCLLPAALNSGTAHRVFRLSPANAFIL